ncbi:DUF4158 domain-containing protein [Nonomuraea sp. NPDC049607]|uniref:DUF4158 domain-containing protein n=1 Tax=Nonomuraea sp. NPDC049607 TaxID=3154732 RepID=UPI0034459C75
MLVVVWGLWVTSINRTAYPRFPRVVTARDLAENFTPVDAEVAWARGRTQDEHHLLMLVVWLKSHQRLGYFPKIGEVPTAVAGHVREALGLAEEVKLRQAAAMTASRRSEFDRLKDVAKAASLGKFKERLALLGAIDALGPTGTWLQSVPPGKVAHFAGKRGSPTRPTCARWARTSG